MVEVVQGLRRLDTALTEADKIFLSDFEKNKTSLEESLKLSERITLSYLWVLGAYELVRTICQRIKEKGMVFPKDLANDFISIKVEFERLRIPLAKMEPARRHKDTDSHIAHPVIHPDRGIACASSAKCFHHKERSG